VVAEHFAELSRNGPRLGCACSDLGWMDAAREVDVSKISILEPAMASDADLAA